MKCLNTLLSCDLGEWNFTLIIPHVAFKYKDKSESRDSLISMLRRARVQSGEPDLTSPTGCLELRTSFPPSSCKCLVFPTPSQQESPRHEEDMNLTPLRPSIQPAGWLAEVYTSRQELGVQPELGRGLTQIGWALPGTWARVWSPSSSCTSHC